MDKIKTKMNEDLLKGLRRKETRRVVLLYSGGIDSTVAGLLLKGKGYDIYPLFIEYGQSSLEAEKYLVKNAPPKLGFKPCEIIKTGLMKQLSKSKLLGGKAVNDSDAWVPGRNTLFMIIAGIYAQQINADGIALGYMLDDNFVFGDNDYFHHLAIEGILSKSFLRPMKVFLPACSLTKKDLIRLLIKEKVLFYTVSCWNAELKDNQIISCKKCANCLEREKFIKEIQLLYNDSKTNEKKSRVNGRTHE